MNPEKGPYDESGTDEIKAEEKHSEENDPAGSAEKKEGSENGEKILGNLEAEKHAAAFEIGKMSGERNFLKKIGFISWLGGSAVCLAMGLAQELSSMPLPDDVGATAATAILISMLTSIIAVFQFINQDSNTHHMIKEYFPEAISYGDDGWPKKIDMNKIKNYQGETSGNDQSQEEEVGKSSGQEGNAQ